MKRKPPARITPPVSPEIIEVARRSVALDPPRPVLKCVVCSSETTAAAPDQLCWVCRRLKISAWRDVEQQIPAQE